MEIMEGIKAPDFKLKGTFDKEYSLKDFYGKTIILYFYPRDNTPGCTNEAIAFKNNIDEIEDLNAVVLGVSRDTLASHIKFTEKHSLPFPLLSDEEEVVCNLYSVLKEKNMYGKKSIGVERSTFIIDEEGIIKKIYRKVKVNGHIEKLIEDLKNIKVK